MPSAQSLFIQMAKQKGYSDQQIQAFLDKQEAAKSKTVQAPQQEEKKQSWIDTPAYDMGENRSGVVGTAGKSVANSGKSLLRFGKGVIDFLNPVETAKKVAQIPKEIVNTSKDQQAAQESQRIATELEKKVKLKTGKAPVAKNVDVTSPAFVGKNLTSAAYKTVTPPAIQKTLQGKGTEALQSVAEDPFQLAPLFLATKGAMDVKLGPGEGAKTFGETNVGKTIDNTVSRTAQVVTKPAKAIVDSTGRTIKSTSKFAASQATGMSPETISTIIENPKEFSPKNIASTDRSGVVSKVNDAINSRLEALSETGKGYETIRKSNGKVVVPSGGAASILKKYGIEIVDGQIKTSKESIPLSPGDKAALQDFVDTFGSEGELSGNAFLNARQALSNLSKYDAAKTNSSQILARDLRSYYDSLGKEHLEGLADLDAKYAPEVQMLRKIKSEYLNADGTLKDNASSKIANLTNKGREQALARLEEISPGITKEVRILKAIEDIKNAGGQKVGTYTRAAIGGAGLVTMNPAAIVAAIIANPSVATQLLRAYGAAVKASNGVIKKASAELLQSLKESNENPNIGLTTRDVSKSFLRSKNRGVKSPQYKELARQGFDQRNNKIIVHNGKPIKVNRYR